MPSYSQHNVIGNPDPTRLDNLKGAGLMLASMFIFAAVDTQAKILSQSLPPLQIVWSRQIGLFIGVVILLMIRGPVLFTTAHPRLQVIRGILAGLSATFFIIGVSLVPLADAIAVTFIAPLIVTILSAFLLHEFVGIHRWLAIMVGFIGTLIIIRPGFESFNPALLFPIFAAVMFAIRQIISRYLGRSEKTETTVAYTAITATLLLTITLPFVWVTPQTQTEFILLSSMAVMGALGEILVIKAFEIGLAVIVSPIQYTIIIWGSFYGYYVFNQLPDHWTWAGTGIIILSGLYTLYRERLRNNKKSD